MVLDVLARLLVNMIFKLQVDAMVRVWINLIVPKNLIGSNQFWSVLIKLQFYDNLEISSIMHHRIHFGNWFTV